VARAWYNRIGDIPHFDHKSPFQIDRESLEGHDLQPVPETLNYQLGMVMWTRPGSEPRLAPATAFHRTLYSDERPYGAIVRRLFEVLELPGEPIAYHSAIGGVLSRLDESDETIYFEDANLLTELLCWIDIRLVLACKEEMTSDHQYGSRPPMTAAFSMLIVRYLDEGWMAGAIEVAEMAERFGQQPWRYEPDDLRSRMEALQVEVLRTSRTGPTAARRSGSANPERPI
jgi:hypothetical protein